ncbi:aminoacyl-tRNA hydrolase [Alkaliphilus oremlandii]|uniref:Peptidyl-tRNA hydrolase n=1 Tax=Alkaliphilus oremlandii (strain OhILAs) TaxID=350688 RepID=PTH_ALKOO|nr:aminoacyl-tRNA hydrolase [Alkaliphilus oremlandii]A8MK43.1 RecName: Full=Peptidyl-tRNA hydrolase; Short=PTH [Alkaliphilus oremlandii OhILAs]ABW20175.1 Aminoacyl-tRNA hydrolase [Alkaliphilus oremlandii OhILAs]
MHIIVGLGNPGKKYDATRHNIGFEAIDMLAKRNNIEVKKLKHKALCGEGTIGGNKVLLVKPQTFMNLSGQSLLDIVQFYKVDPKNIVVLYDDIDIPVGTLRIREKGSSGTHNGMKSIIYLLQTDQFPRIRIGVGKPQFGDLADYVLGRFPKEEIPTMLETLERASQAVETLVKDGIAVSMNRYNG